MSATTTLTESAEETPLAPAPAEQTGNEELERCVLAALATVDDPEYPGVSIVDLGLLEQCDVDPAGRVVVGLVPTFSGCPALGVIADDVTAAIAPVPGVQAVDVRWLASPVWSTDRVSDLGRAALADQFTVAVEIGANAPTCPRCGSALTPSSMFGPSRCRSVSRCEACSETVEVMRA